ncbi:MlaD family protein [Danxiaibacter flavus]|uniref:MlaD family protein n=1 Tax=Danxiaibacter flavus TaxID=3049108 RepID=A0ABV3Z8S6_9BACT|nr:MlaD family protein [Chitinophagaceae bacterium DXS]
MKISNETKIGALTAVAIALLILGFNFLKGKSLFRSGFFLYAKYDNTKGLLPSHPVFVNGYQVGSVYEIEAADKNVKEILVTIKLSRSYNIPANSEASIKDNPLGTPSLDIKLGTSTSYLHSDDTLRTSKAGGLLDAVSAKLGPVADQLAVTLGSLDSLLRNANSVLDPHTKGNLQSVIANLNNATASLVKSSASLQTMLNTQTGALANTLDNMSSFSETLASNKEKLNNTVSNIEKTTENLSKADIDGVVNNLKASVEKLNNTMEKVNSTDGSLGSLINDKALYTNLNNTVRSLNTLMDDLRVHPKRYVNISVFGKKDKGNYLTQPLSDTVTTSSTK